MNPASSTALYGDEARRCVTPGSTKPVAAPIHSVHAGAASAASERNRLILAQARRIEALEAEAGAAKNERDELASRVALLSTRLHMYSKTDHKDHGPRSQPTKEQHRLQMDEESPRKMKEQIVHNR